MAIIAGIDPSLTGFAVCVGDGQDDAVARFSSSKLGEGVVPRMKRIDMLVGDAMKLLDEWRPDAVFIEAYSFGSKFNREVMAEVGAIARWHLVDFTDKVFEVAPTTLKKFTTGSGKGQKDQMAAHVVKRWKRMFSNNDEVDAFALYRLGLVAAGIVEPDNLHQEGACSTVLKGLNLKLELQSTLDHPAF